MPLIGRHGGRIQLNTRSNNRRKEERAKSKGSPVKFAPLVFFEEFNGASRGQKQKKKKEERAKSKGQGSPVKFVPVKQKTDRFHPDGI